MLFFGKIELIDFRKFNSEVGDNTNHESKWIIWSLTP